MIEEGSFTVTNEKDQELARVGKGSCFGELALLRQVSLAIGSLKVSESLPACRLLPLPCSGGLVTHQVLYSMVGRCCSLRAESVMTRWAKPLALHMKVWPQQHAADMHNPVAGHLQHAELAGKIDHGKPLFIAGAHGGSL